MTALRFMVICATMAIVTGCSDSTDAGPPATQLAFTMQPASDTIGAPLAPVAVTARDVAGDVATGFIGAVTMALADNPGNATLSGTLVVDAIAGVATFSNLSLGAAEEGYTLTATSGTLTPATSAVFDMSEVVVTMATQYYYGVDLETGTARDCGVPCTFEPADDFSIAHNSAATPPGAVVQNQSNGTQIAHLASRAFGGVHLADTVGAGFTTALSSTPFDDAHTVLIRTAAGNVFKLGNAADLGSPNVRFQFARLN